MNVFFVHAMILYDGDDALTPGVVGWALTYGRAGKSGLVVDTRDFVIADDEWEWTAPPVEHKKVQKKQHHEQGRVLIEEHFQGP